MLLYLVAVFKFDTSHKSIIIIYSHSNALVSVFIYYMNTEHKCVAM